MKTVLLLLTLTLSSGALATNTEQGKKYYYASKCYSGLKVIPHKESQKIMEDEFGVAVNKFYEEGATQKDLNNIEAGIVSCNEGQGSIVTFQVVLNKEEKERLKEDLWMEAICQKYNEVLDKKDISFDKFIEYETADATLKITQHTLLIMSHINARESFKKLSIANADNFALEDESLNDLRIKYTIRNSADVIQAMNTEIKNSKEIIHNLKESTLRLNSSKDKIYEYCPNIIDLKEVNDIIEGIKENTEEKNQSYRNATEQ